MWEQFQEAVGAIQAKSDKKFGDPEKPLLVSCRSGAKFLMPGMMDTVLNIGLNDETAQAMIALTGDARFVFDAYRRLIQMFGSVVMGVPDEVFEKKITQLRAKTGAKTDTELTGDNWKALTEEFKTIYRQQTHHPNLTNLKIRLQHVNTLEKVDTLLTQIAQKETEQTRGQMFRQRFKVSPIDTEVNHIAGDCQTYDGQQRVG